MIDQKRVVEPQDSIELLLLSTLVPPPHHISSPFNRPPPDKHSKRPTINTRYFSCYTPSSTLTSTGNQNTAAPHRRWLPLLQKVSCSLIELLGSGNTPGAPREASHVRRDAVEGFPSKVHSERMLVVYGLLAITTGASAEPWSQIDTS